MDVLRPRGRLICELRNALNKLVSANKAAVSAAFWVDEVEQLKRVKSVELGLHEGGLVEQHDFVVPLEDLPHNNIPPHHLIVEIGPEMLEEARFERERLALVREAGVVAEQAKQRLFCLSLGVFGTHVEGLLPEEPVVVPVGL